MWNRIYPELKSLWMAAENVYMNKFYHVYTWWWWRWSAPKSIRSHWNDLLKKKKTKCHRAKDENKQNGREYKQERERGGEP